ncbi:MAG: PrsW family intramembrane metalloprotease [Clostridia bacterium]|nr:PrsW family intramembrane metalloprotease [Clostridia bacterium]MBR3094120.1 PrsW family intramembrane metalloprotease [Clostridia bacterium]
MFYFLLTPYLTYHFILIAAAVIPAVFLMLRVWRADRLEPESPRLLLNLTVAGIISALLALLSERVLSFVLDHAVAQNTVLYQALLYFVVVAVSEESAKYFMLRRRTWRSPEFNCQYDGVVYAVFVSLGFALWENISYVLHFGFQTALVRAVTAIPGHACFGVFMGVFYGIAKRLDNEGRHAASKAARCFGLLVSILLHGAYDFIASMETEQGSWYFVGFVAVLFVLSFILVGKTAKKDRYIA